MKQKINKEKICCIMQPLYLPWMGYFDLIDRSDTFVFYDDVQLVRRSWCTRNRIKTPNGELTLTVPIKKTNHRDDLLYKDAKIDYDSNWTEKHLKSIEINYKKALFFEEFFGVLEKILLKNRYENLAELNISIIKSMMEHIGIKTKVIRSSEISKITGKKDERLKNICKKLKFNNYLSPQGSAEYIESQNPGGVFSLNKINLLYQNFEHPSYRQLWGDFISHLSIIDCLMNVGKEKTLSLIKEGQKNNYTYSEFRNKILKK